MKDLPLSVLSRGCGQYVPCEGQQNRRLDVCFTPEDYYIWKSQGPILQLSTSGSMLTGLEPTLPKTFSTRRGALLLYSQGLTTWKTCPSNICEAKDYRQCRAQSVQQGEQKLSISKESILNHTAVLERNDNMSTTTLSSLHVQPPVEYFETFLPQNVSTLDHNAQMQRMSLFAESGSAQKGSHHAERRKRTLDLHLPPITTASSQKTRHPSADNTEALTASENLLRTSVEQIGKDEETRELSDDINFHPSKNSSKYKSIIDKTSSSTHPDTRQHEPIGGSEKDSTFLPPLKAGQSVSNESYTVFSEKGVKGQYTKRLPPIDQSGSWSHMTEDAKPVKSTDRLQQPLCLPVLVPEKLEEVNILKKRKDICGKHKHETLSHKIRDVQSFENDIHISFNTGQECNASFGLLAGKRGPGHQSSLAFLQKVSEDPNESSIREVVRGLLPLELRDLNGQAVGSLILGPDGEVIQLSMLGNIQDTSQSQALEVLSSKGEKLPWVVVLQPEHQLTGENEEKVLPRFNIQTNPFFNELSDQQRSQDADAVRTKAHLDDIYSTDQNNTKSGIRRSIKNLIEENTLENLPNLDGAEVEEQARDDTKTKDKKNAGGGQLSHLQMQLMESYQPDEMINHNMSPRNAATSQKTEKDSNKRKGTEERPIAMGKVKETRSALEQQVASGQEKQERMRERGQDHDQDKTLATKRAGSKEMQTRDTEKTKDKRVNQDHAEESSNERSQEKRKGKFKYKDLISEKTTEQLTAPATNSSQEIEEEINKHRREGLSAKQKHSADSDVTRDGPDTDTDCFPVHELRLNSNTHSRSVRSLRSNVGGSDLKHSSSQRSMSSSGEGGTLGGFNAPLSMSRSRLSSCSTVMIPEERLALNPTKAEVVVTQEDKATVFEAKLDMIQKEEEEKERKEQEEEQKRQQQREELEEKMRNELQNERQRRAEEIRLKKQAEEEERRQHEEEDQRRQQRQQEQREREIRRQQARKRQMEHFQKKREEEEQRRKAEMERLQLLEEKRLQEERMKLQEMTESERAEYLRKKQEEEVIRQKEEEERRRREEEAALLAAEKAKIEEELLAREMALLHQRLSFKRGLMVDSEGLEKSQCISRPWTYSYFTLLQMLGLSSAEVRHS